MPPDKPGSGALMVAAFSVGVGRCNARPRRTALSRQGGHAMRGYRAGRGNGDVSEFEVEAHHHPVALRAAQLLLFQMNVKRRAAAQIALGTGQRLVGHECVG